MPKSSAASRIGYWLVKSEADSFSIDDLARAKRKTTHWDGVRNYQARNMLRDNIQVGDQVLYYHSNTAEPSIVGRAQVVRAGYPDFTAWDEHDPHYDPKSSADHPRWYMIDIQFVEKFATPLTLNYLRTLPALKDMVLLRKGSRLSVQPVTAAEFTAIIEASSNVPR